MPDEEFRCPSCRAPQNRAAPGSEVKCVFCKTVYRVPVPEVATRVASAAVTPMVTPRGRGVAGLLAMSVGAMVVAASVLVFVRYRSPAGTEPSAAVDGMPSDGPSASLPFPASTPAPLPTVTAPAAPEVEPSAEVRQVLDGTNSIGGRFYLVELENDGAVPIASPAVVASGYDASGHRVLEQPGYAHRQALAPGESAVILVSISSPPPTMTRVDIAPRLRGGAPTFRDVAVVVVESTERASFGSMHEIVGTVRNDGTSQVQFVHVVAVGRDAEGKPVSFADAYPTNHTLAPGETSGFTLSVGTWEIRRPTRWELVAFGR